MLKLKVKNIIRETESSVGAVAASSTFVVWNYNSGDAVAASSIFEVTNDG